MSTTIELGGVAYPYKPLSPLALAALFTALAATYEDPETESAVRFAALDLAWPDEAGPRPWPKLAGDYAARGLAAVDACPVARLKELTLASIIVTNAEYARIAPPSPARVEVALGNSEAQPAEPSSDVSTPPSGGSGPAVAPAGPS